jgi:cell division protein FtsI/penicillin-binding protein 2
MNKEINWRYKFMGFGFVVVGLIIIGQLIRIQFNPELDKSEKYEGQYVIIQPARGQIYDRWGNLLVGNSTVYEIGVDLRYVRDVEDAKAIAFALQAIIGKDYEQVFGQASQGFSKNSVYAVLADYVSPEKKALLEKYIEDHEEHNLGRKDSPSLSSLVFRPHLGRNYPEKDLASNILGFVSRKDGRGYFGVEEFYNEQLAGVARKVWVPNDPNLVEDLPEIPPGTSLVLTIDREIQAIVEDILDDAVSDTKSKAGAVIVMDPGSGEIYAMASWPRLDLNEYWKFPEIFPGTTPFNRAVSGSYEPGSVYKVLTMAAGLDAGIVTPDFEYTDLGYIEVGGIIIRNWDRLAYGLQTMLGCMRHSLNVCLAWLGTELGNEDFYGYMDRFGIGHLSGIDLAGEASGRLKLPGDGDWTPSDLGTNSFGQGVSVTPIQMLKAVSAIANDGKMVIPHLVRARVNDGNQYPIAPTVDGTPIRSEIARELTELLAVSLEEEASDAMVTGYRLAGKTGTAEIPTEEGYTRAVTNASFVGWGPVDAPQFLVYVWMEEPGSSIWGSDVAAPMFSEVVEQLVVLLSIPPDDVRLGLSGQ